MNAPVPLPSRLAVGDLALASIRAVCSAIEHPLVDAAAIDPVRAALSYRSDRFLTIEGRAPDVWSALSGFWRTSDGWVRTHANYPHHAAALRSAFGMPTDAGAAALSAVLSRSTTVEAITSITDAGGLVVPVSEEDPPFDETLRRTPLVETLHLGAAEPRSPLADIGLHGIRVLDLTRVIAGPVCTRTLALLGADVLRIDPPGLPEPEWQHLDTGHGKRSAVLDAESPSFAALLAAADVVVLGYRPGALARLGLDPRTLAERHPGLVVAQLSAWGTDQPERRGFDSLVQAASGIAMIESPDGERPGALPAQALDHSAGYLLAAAICGALRTQRRDGGSRLVRTSLRRVAAELLGMPRTAAPAPETPVDTVPHRQTFSVGGQSVTTVRSVIPGLEFAAPRPFGRDAPRW